MELVHVYKAEKLAVFPPQVCQVHTQQPDDWSAYSYSDVHVTHNAHVTTDVLHKPLISFA
jgi:hypothetical protein